MARDQFEEADLSHAQLGDAGFSSAVADLYLMLLCTQSVCGLRHGPVAGWPGLDRPRTKEVVMFAALSVLLLIGCLLPAATKLAGHPRMRESARHFQIPWRHYRLIGIAELAAAAGVLAGLWWHPLGVAAATGMAILLVGALIAHRRAGDHGKEVAPALITLLIAVGYLIAALT